MIRNSSGIPHSPIGLSAKTFENKDLQQVLADKRKRRPTGSPASRIFKSALPATNTSTTMYENKRKLKNHRHRKGTCQKDPSVQTAIFLGPSFHSERTSSMLAT